MGSCFSGIVNLTELCLIGTPVGGAGALRFFLYGLLSCANRGDSSGADMGDMSDRLWVSWELNSRLRYSQEDVTDSSSDILRRRYPNRSADTARFCACKCWADRPRLSWWGLTSWLRNPTRGTCFLDSILYSQVLQSTKFSQKHNKLMLPPTGIVLRMILYHL